MLRTLTQIQRDIKHCQAQIAATYDNQTPQNSTETEIIREGFQRQLNKLNDEETEAISNIRIINPRIYTVDGLRELDIPEYPLDGMDYQSHQITKSN